MLRSYNSVNNSGQVIDVGQRFDAEDDIIEGTLAGLVSSVRSLFGTSNNCDAMRVSIISIDTAARSTYHAEA